MAKRIVVHKTKPQQPTRADIEHAAEDARTIVAQSQILQTCVTAMIASRRLYMLTRSVLDNEIQHGWEIDNPELVIQTLEMSAQEKAMENFTALDLQQALLGLVLPFVDIAVQQQAADAAQPKDTSDDSKPESPGAVLPGSDDANAGGLGAVCPGPAAGPEHRGPGEEGCGRGEEAGGAG